MNNTPPNQHIAGQSEKDFVMRMYTSIASNFQSLMHISWIFFFLFDLFIDVNLLWLKSTTLQDMLEAHESYMTTNEWYYRMVQRSIGIHCFMTKPLR